MGNKNPNIPDLRTLIIGCTPLARKVIQCAKEESNFVGAVNLHPDLGLSKSNYDSLGDICDPFFTKDINNKETEEWIRQQNPDVIIQCGWSQIFKSNILKIPKRYCLGIHPSPLPVGRGAAVLNWKILESDGNPVPWGNSLFIMEEKTDTGAVLEFRSFVIEPRDNIRTIYHKVDQTAVDMVRMAIPKIANRLEIKLPQDKALATRYYKRSPEDGKIDLSWSATKINDYVRALTHPYPGAFVETRFGKLSLWQTSTDICKVHGSPGLICAVVKGKGVLVKVAGFKCVWLERVSLDGIEMWADEWASTPGVSLKVGVILIER